MTIQRLLDALTGGEPVDWDDAERRSPDDESRRQVHELRTIARIFDAHQQGRQHANELRPVPCLWGSLHVEEFIARGAHGDVYRAWDPRLERHVALKLLHDERSSEAAERAPIAEGRLLARVRHPNVVTVFGADRVDGRAGVWMEFVNGRTVREQIETDGPFTPAKAAVIASAVCAGLAAVHDAGLIHRDVKAQNVVEDDSGRTILMDLGAGQETDEPDERVEGTPVYLAPELLKGGRATAASDIYAAGVLLFYMMTGRHPVHGRSIDTLREYYESDANNAARVNAGAEVPSRLARVIARALSPNPTDRFASACDMKEGIETAARPRARRWLLIAGGVVAAATLASIGASWQRLTARRISFQEHDALLVASFDNHTGNPVLDGTVDFLFQRELSSTPYISVVSRARVDDALRLMRRPPSATLDLGTAREIATRDGEIRAVVAGRIDRVGTTYSLTAQLVDPISGVVVAMSGENVAGESELPAAVRREALAIRDALGERRESLAISRETLAKVSTPSLRALQLYSQAASQWVPPTNMALAETILRQALAVDPQFASAHLLFAWALHNQRRSPSDYMPPAEEALRLSATATQPEQDFIAGSLHDFRAEIAADETTKQNEGRLALAAYEALLAEQPTHQWVAGNLNNLYGRLHMRPEQYRAITRAADRQPLSFVLNVNASRDSFALGDAAAAERYYRRAASAPRDEAGPIPIQWVTFFQAHAAWAAGNLPQAARLSESIVSTIPAIGRSDLRAFLGRGAVITLLSLGQTHRAEEIARSISDEDARRASTIVVLEARHDVKCLRQLLESRVTQVKSSMAPDWIMVEGSSWIMAGFLEETRRVLRDAPIQVAPLAQTLSSKLAFTEGRYADAVTAGLQSLRGQEQAGGTYQLRTAEVVAQAMRALGKTDEAISLLEQYTAHREESVTGLTARADFWISARMQLASLYRETGRPNEAAELETEAAKFLAVADSDHPLVLELKRRAALYK